MFKDQVSNETFMQVIFYSSAVVFLFLVVIGLCFVDGGLVQRKNLVDTLVQKLLCAFISGLAMLVIGYGIWEWQFNQAFGVPNGLSDAIGKWWIFGDGLNKLPQTLDPAVFPSADVFQAFAAFFLAWAAVFGALLHSAGTERTKRLPLYVMSALGGGLVMPIVAYLTWGSASPLTNNGLHDYLGVYALYMLVGTWALVLAWRTGPRRKGDGPHDLGWTALGVGLVLVGVPFVLLGCGYFVPGEGYFGISLTSSGLGRVLVSTFVAFGAGAIAGAVVAYRTRNIVMLLLGPVAGYIGCAGALDVYTPWQAALVAAGAVGAVHVGMKFMERIKVDEMKVVPLTIFGGGFGIIAAGFIAWGEKQGGFFGAEGEFALQGAQITPWMQILGVVITLAIGLGSGLALVLLLEKTVGLRVSPEAERDGFDLHYWGIPPVSHQPDLAAMEAETNGHSEDTASQTASAV
jgi:ammonia channel protein AmtB